MQQTDVRKVALQKAMRLTVLNILLNLFLVGVKAAAGVLADCEVLVNDAIHSGADMLCTALVLSGLWLSARYGEKTARKIQTVIILFLGGVIACTGVSMAVSAAELLLLKSRTQTNTAAAGTAAFCMLVKACMAVLTERTAKRLESQLLLADAYHHRCDCMSSLLVLCSVLFSFLSGIYPEVAMRFLLSASLLHSAVGLIKDKCKKETKEMQSE